MKEKKKTKVTLIIIKQLIELFSSYDNDNKLMAYSMLNSLDWDITKPKHIFYIEMFWYTYTGSFAAPDDVLYPPEREFAKLIKKLGLNADRNEDFTDYVTVNLEKKYISWAKRNNIPNYQDAAISF